jgi:stage V sporulation protein S
MNRFFSKLDLRDIKIDPSGSHFPPDAEDYQEPEEAQEVDVAVADANHVDEHSYEATTQTWEDESTAVDSGNNHVAEHHDYVANGNQSGEVLKVSARSRPSAVAGAIAGVVRESGRAEVQAIGAGATNQAVKAVAIARDYLRETGIEAICLPAFIDVTIDNEDRTAIRLVVEPR